MTQAELAERVGVAQKHISRWESDKTTPNLESFKKICIAIGISSDVILGIITGDEAHGE